ncbi:threonine-type endopeptidase [Aureococcus anophagefferens]|nr:threonine-type endopeptidase [Aureococcus anophagefferens]
MFRSQYDTDVTVWSPQGRLLQVEYAMEAVKQGSACLGIVGEGCVVLAALKRQPNELSGYQRKLLKIDEHMTIAVAGLNADARTLAKTMRTECLNHRYVYGAPLQGARLVLDIADKYQRCTQMYTCPSGNYNEYVAVAIGARAQSAKTYLEKHVDAFKGCGVDELCKHALKGLAGCVAGDKELDAASASLAIVSFDAAAGEAATQIIEDGDVQKYLDTVEIDAAAAQAENMAVDDAPAADAMA